VSTQEKVDIVVTAQTDGATQKLKETAGATEQMATAAKAAGAEQAALTVQLQRAQKAQADSATANQRLARAQDEATMTARAHGAASTQAAEAEAKLARATETARAAAKALATEEAALTQGIAAATAATDKASPALAKLAKEADKVSAAAERQAAEVKRAELAQLAAAKASGKGAEGFSLLGAAGSKLTGLLGVGLAASLAGVGSQLSEMAEKTLQYETAMRNLPFALDGAKKATHGMVSEQELAIAASQAVALGVVKTQKEFDQLASDASKIALKLGSSSGQMLGDLTTALGRGSAMILDNAGIILKVSDANERYAASVGKTVEQLSEAEKKIAFQTAAMEAIRKSADATTVAYDGNAAAILRVKTAWGDAMASMERATVNAVGGTITLITGAKDELIKLHGVAEQTVVASDKWAVSTGLAAQATAAWAAELLLGADALEMVQRIALDEQNLAAAAKLTDQERAKRDVLAQEADFAERQAKAMEKIGKEHESFLDEQAMRSIVYGPEEAPKADKKKSGRAVKAKDIRSNGDIQRARIFDGRDESNAVAWDAMAAGREDAAAREAAAVAEQVAAQERAIDALTREMEAREAAGMQAEDLIDRRIAAERKLADYQRKNARDDRAREQAETRMMKAEHDKRLRDLRAASAAQIAEEKKREAVIGAVTSNVQSLGSAMVGAMQAQAEGAAGAIALELESWLKGVRNQMIVKSLVEFALAAGSAASFNPVGAAAHAAAGGLAVAAAVAAGAGGAIVGASNEARGLHDSPGSKASGSSGGGGAARGDSPGGGHGGGGAEYAETPVSREAARRDVDMPRHSQAPAPASHTSVTVNVTGLMAGSERELASKLDRLLRKAPLGGRRA